MYGGEGVASVCRYLWYTPHSEKVKMNPSKEDKWKKEEEEDQREASR
jgi:hypothetical protein